MMKTKVLMLAAFAMDRHDAELIHFSSITNGLKNLGYDVLVYHLSRKNKPAIKDLLEKDISFHEIFIKCKSNNEMFIKGILAYPAFLKSILLYHPQIIYTRLGIVTGIYSILTKLIFKNRIKIITEHNGWIGPEASSTGKPRYLAFIGKEIQRLSARNSDSVRAVSQGIKDYLINLGIHEKTIRVIGNGTDIRHFFPSRVDPLYDIGFIGNLAVWMGLDWLLESFKILLESRPNLKLAITGDGSEYKRIEKMIQDIGIESNVFMPGSIPYDSAPEIINNFRICIATFRPKMTEKKYQSVSSMKIRDYAACGKPIVSSNIPGLEEIELNKFGYLIEPGHIQGYVDAINSILEDSSLEKEMGNRARKYAEDNYSWDTVCLKISELINNLTSNVTGRK